MTASKRRKNHPSILQVPSISSLFSVLPRVILGKTQRNKTCQSSAISLHNQPISREYLPSSSTSFSNQLLPQIILRENKGRKPLFGKFSLIDLAGNERGADTRFLEFCRSSYQMSIYEDHLTTMNFVLTISFSALQTGKPEWREPRSTSPFLPSRSV